MQQSCSSCLARRTLNTKGIRSYGVVPKPPPKPKPNPAAEKTVRRSPKARFGLPNNERVDQRHGTKTTGKSSNPRPDGARRSRLAGYLDDDATSTPINVRDSPRTPLGSMTSEPSKMKPTTRADDRYSTLEIPNWRGVSRRPLYPLPRDSTSIETGSTGRSTRESFPPAAQPSQDNETSSSRRKYHFKALHHDTAIQAFHRPSTPSNPIIKYRDSYLFLRAAPTHTLPTPPPSPFPPGLPTLKSKHPNMEIINFGVVASKNAVSPFAPERGKVRKRFKNAVEEVVNKGTGVLRSDWSYLAVLNREVYEADMRDICGSLENGLKFIRRQQERGFGSDTGHGMRRR